MSKIEFILSFLTDKGLWGRECNICLKYFKIDSDKIKEKLYCPYCGEHQPNSQLWTKEQNEAKKKIAIAVGKRYIEDELGKMFADLARGNKNVSYKAETRTQIPQQSTHLEKEVDTEIVCPSCDTKFQVYGIFGFCPGCREDNMLIYEANLKIILTEIDKTDDPIRTLRHAYNDLVSTFEAYCKMVSLKYDLGSTNFQNLKSTKEHFKKHGVDIYARVNDYEKTSVKRVFEKRHAFQHAKGKITSDYVKNIPEDRNLIDTIAVLSKDEFIGGIEVLKKIFRNITSKYSS